MGRGGEGVSECEIFVGMGVSRKCASMHVFWVELVNFKVFFRVSSPIFLSNALHLALLPCSLLLVISQISYLYMFWLLLPLSSNNRWNSDTATALRPNKRSSKSHLYSPPARKHRALVFSAACLSTPLAAVRAGARSS